MKDLIFRGSIAGCLGIIGCYLANLLLYFTGLVPYTGIHYNAIFLTPPGTPVNTLTGTIGVIAGFVAGSFVGVLIAFLLEQTGYELAWFKGLGVGVVLWPVHVGIIPNLMAERLYDVLPPIMVLACFFFEAIFGTITGIAMNVLAKKE